jgi:TPR repeat protein
MHVLGDIYYHREEHEQAVKWFTKAAEAGLPRAMYNLGFCLDQGEGVAAPDYPAAEGWYRRAADAGHASAMYEQARSHNARKQHEQAVEWFTKAAEAGLPRAMYDLGCILDKGEGVAAPDYPAAADWYRRAADLGNASAAANLATMYTFGTGRARAWRIMPATSTPHFSSSFLESSGLLRRIDNYLPGRGARRHAEQAAGETMDA